MNNIKILDCTLRDGGYINNWEFGNENSKIIIECLQKAKLDYIELGFIVQNNTSNSQTLFNSFEKIKKFIPNKSNKNKLLGMITYGTFPIEQIPTIENAPISGIRVIFKKEDKDSALTYCEKIKDKGYKLFINPTFTDQYSDNEFIELLNKIQKIHPYGISIVDSMGVMKEKDILRLFYLIDNNLDNKIALCFHSHNNLQLSFPNAQCLMKVCQNRELIIDSTVFGMGRGAGNLCTELLVQYLNDNYNTNYDIIPILKIVDEQINPIFAKTPWGYSVPYYLAATNHCHPNYAKYLVDKQTVPVEVINSLLKSIPKAKKANFDKDFIRQLYLDKFSNKVDDNNVLEIIKEILTGRNILILAPGKSLNSEKNTIKNYIKKEKPLIITLNFKSDDYNEDIIFVTNLKRFSNLKNIDTKLIVTSNITNVPENAMVLNYSSYLNNSPIYDNTALMLFKALIKIGIKNISIAGFDGFSHIATENYAKEELINTIKYKNINNLNNFMIKELDKISKNIKIEFITKSIYNIKENNL